MTPSHFVEALGKLDLPNTFNPYSDCCTVHDYDDAPRRRCDALRSILQIAAESDVDSLWIGRDLGYRGGRRTGLAFTDDVHMLTHAKRWGASIEQPTKGEVVAERTATIIWRILNQINTSVFLWNVFPLHPHESNSPFSNRAHNSRERQTGEEFLYELISLLRPRKLVPIGKDAASVTCRLSESQEIFQIRHPSYGGQNKFLSQTQELYGFTLRGVRT